MTLPTIGYVRQAQLLAGGVPFSAATLWRKVRAQTFPAPVKLSAGITAWRVEDVRSWMDNQPARPGNTRSTSEEGGPVIDDALIERLTTASLRSFRHPSRSRSTCGTWPRSRAC